MSNVNIKDKKADSPGFDVRPEEGGGTGVLLSGRIDAGAVAKLWPSAMALAGKVKGTLVVDASAVEYLDGAGLGLLVELRRRIEAGGGEMSVVGLSLEIHEQYESFSPDVFQIPEKAGSGHMSFPEQVGRGAVYLAKDLGNLIAYVGELTVALILALVRPASVRWKDAFYAMESAGINALPIVVLISFLVGLIMSFQAAIPMRMFGAEIFVADLIALSMVRELGPLMTAIVLTGRSGSAFAAEIGTMMVNEEINALNTMGLEPVRFLIVPRVIAAVTMTPLLTMFANLVGIIGGAIVIVALGYPLQVYFKKVVSAITYVDLLGGLVKSFVFGIMIAGIGCKRGLETGTGPSAVGESTTRAVVSGIVLIVVVDGIFSLVFFYLGI